MFEKQTDGCSMKNYWSPRTIVLIALISFSSLTGCGDGKQPITPEQKEQKRQKMIQNAERERRESK
jgi:hypothetical protein